LKHIKVVTKGGKRYVYRRVGGALVPLPDLPENDDRFLAAYAKAGSVTPRRTRGAEGSIEAAAAAFLASGTFARMAASTRATVRRSVDRIASDRGAGLLVDLRADHLRKDLRALTPGAAINRLKAWRWILRHAVETGVMATDPSAGIKPPRGTTTPHRQWTGAEIAAFRDHWAPGTQQRQAMEVLHWTGARCVDAVRFGWQLVTPDGWLRFVQAKTGGPATVPVHRLPGWCTALQRDHAAFLAELPADRLQWIVTAFGKPRSQKGLSQWFSAAATEAGLPADCTAHGLRKARAAALAEVGATGPQIGAWTGHASLSEIAHYTRGADQAAILGAERPENMGNRIRQLPKKTEKP